jgi:alpha-tubulin suppressor-like RCC1 family protein
MTSGGIRCWGSNTAGQLGDGTEADRPTPPTSDVLTGVQAIAAGDSHTCTVMASGGIRCWGYNICGQLGNANGANHSTPPTTDVLTGVQTIAMGGAYVCALRTTGGVRCWGYNSNGQLGDGTTMNRSTPPTSAKMSSCLEERAGAGNNHLRVSGTALVDIISVIGHWRCRANNGVVLGQLKTEEKFSR